MHDLMAATAPFQGVALALALGLLIGIERGWSRRQDPDGARVAGIRTFTMLGLLGGMAGEAGRQISPALAAVIVGIAGLALLIGYARTAEPGRSVSATTTIVGIATLAIGVFAATGQGVLASVLAAVTTIVLSLRRQLHGWLGQLSEAEFHAIARFALLSLAILPLLPDQPYGPYGAWNPRQIGMVVVLVSGLSLVGYAAAKHLGSSRGILATAAAGALVSSTAVTASLAARIRSGDGAAATLTAGVALASAVMVLRVLGLVAVLVPFALSTLAVLAGPGAVVGIACTAWLLRRPAQPDGGQALPASLRNPFDLKPALVLAGLVMALSLLARWAQHQFGDAGLAVTLAVSGMLDVDSAIITLSGLPTGCLNDEAAGLILAAPLMMNTLVKAGLVLSVAGLRAGWQAALVLVSSAIAGAVALLGLVLLPFGA